MNNTLTKLTNNKNTGEGFNSRLYEAEESISELKDRAMEPNQSEQQVSK